MEKLTNQSIIDLNILNDKKIDNSGNVYVADSGNHRIQIFLINTE